MCQPQYKPVEKSLNSKIFNKSVIHIGKVTWHDDCLDRYHYSKKNLMHAWRNSIFDPYFAKGLY